MLAGVNRIVFGQVPCGVVLCEHILPEKLSPIPDVKPARQMVIIDVLIQWQSVVIKDVAYVRVEVHIRIMSKEVHQPEEKPSLGLDDLPLPVVSEAIRWTLKSLENEKVIVTDAETLCSVHETCPRFPNSATVVHFGFDDPPKLAAEETDPERALNHFRRVRNEIRVKIERWLTDIDGSSTESP